MRICTVVCASVSHGHLIHRYGNTEVAKLVCKGVQMQEDDLASLGWTGVLPRWKTHTHRVTGAQSVYWLVHSEIFDQEHAHVRARTNRQRDRITCNHREYGTYTHIYIHIPVAFSLLQPICWNYDARDNSNYLILMGIRSRNTNSLFLL